MNIEMELGNVKTIALKQELFGLSEGTQFEKVNDLFVCNIVDSIEGDGYSYTRKETRSYNSAVIEEYKDLFEVVEYTEEYKKTLEEALKEANSKRFEQNKPFKPRKEIRKLINKYEKMIETVNSDNELSNGERHNAVIVYWNLIKVLKWVINESDEQIC